MSDDKPPQLTVDELKALIETDLEEAQGRIEAYEERRAIERESLEDGTTTDQRAISALRRSERFHGEHAVANGWLFNSETARIFKSGK